MGTTTTTSTAYWLVRTSAQTWGVGESLVIARRNARVRRGMSVQATGLSCAPEDLRFGLFGDASWSNSECVVTESWLSEPGKRKRRLTAEELGD